MTNLQVYFSVSSVIILWDFYKRSEHFADGRVMNKSLQIQFLNISSSYSVMDIFNAIMIFCSLVGVPSAVFLMRGLREVNGLFRFRKIVV
jgi:hypothetical protein